MQIAEEDLEAGIIRKKVVIIGDGACGKTCLAKVYQDKMFDEKHIPTIIQNFLSEEIEVNNKKYELAIWDTAGQQEFAALRTLAYQDVDVVVIAFSLRPEDMAHNGGNLKMWLKEAIKEMPDAKRILVGTKSDLLDKETTEKERMKRQCEAKAFRYVECSAKENKNVTEVFHQALMASIEGGPNKQKRKICRLF